MSGGLILMGVRDGAAHLAAQLDSIAAQTDPGWQVVASDDGSRDASAAILSDWGRDHPLELRAGPGQGFARNFLGLVAALPARAPWVAFSDQDDIWLPEKLAVARAALAPAGDIPALYCGRRLIWDPRTDARRPSRAYPRPPAFGNALIENIAPGNTIVLNPAAAALARDAAPRAGAIYAHDWWLYLLITGAGGRVIWDAVPRLLYRQHGANAIGAGESLARGLANKGAVLRGRFARRLAGNVAALAAVRDRLTPGARAQLDLFTQARTAPLPRRLALLRRAGVYRQGALSGAGFWGAAWLGKI